jgi:hypothetical protein
VSELPPAIEGYGLKVIIGIATSVRNGSITDLEISDFFRRLIDEAVRVASACFEACAHTRRQLGSTFVGVQCGPPTENKDEFVLRRMRMPQGRTRAWQGVKLTPKLVRPNRSPSGRFSRPRIRAANGSG